MNIPQCSVASAAISYFLHNNNSLFSNKETFSYIQYSRRKKCTMLEDTRIQLNVTLASDQSGTVTVFD